MTESKCLPRLTPQQIYSKLENIYYEKFIIFYLSIEYSEREADIFNSRCLSISTQASRRRPIDIECAAANQGWGKSTPQLTLRARHSHTQHTLHRPANINPAAAAIDVCHMHIIH